MSTLGLNGFTLTDRERTWSKDDGYGWVFTYTGPKATANEFFAQISSEYSSDDVRMSIADGVATVTRTVQDSSASGDPEGSDIGEPQSSEQNDIWEVSGQTIYRDLINFSGRPEDATTPDFTSNDYIDGTGDKYIQDELVKVRKAVEMADDTYNSQYITNRPILQYNGLLRRGVTEYQRSLIVLRRTIPCGSRSLVQLAWWGVDRAWKLDGEEGSPNLKRADQGALIGAIERHPDFNAAKKQWLKMSPQISTTGGGKYNIVYEWIFAKEWSWCLYGGDGIGGNIAPNLL